jgi:hypothetical protein
MSLVIEAMEKSPTSNGGSSFLSTVGFLQLASFNQPRADNNEYYHFVTAITVCVKGARGGAVG